MKVKQYSLLFAICLVSQSALSFKVKSHELHLLSSSVSGEMHHYMVEKKDLAGLSEWDGIGSRGFPAKHC